MLSYQHAYHAGSAADLHKHVALAVLLAPLAGRGALYLESHAGRGLYDLAGAEATKTGEAEAGLGRLKAALPDGPPEGPFWDLLTALARRDGQPAYPGSPCVAATLLGAGDRLILHECHPAELKALRRARRRLDVQGRATQGPEVEIVEADGHAGLRALRPGRRPGIALIDPSYEVKDEYAETALTAARLAAAWPAGTIVVWYPVLPAARHEGMAAALAEAAEGPVFRHEVAFCDPPARGMQGSGLLCLGLPCWAPGALAAALAPCAPVFRTVAAG